MIYGFKFKANQFELKANMSERNSSSESVEM